MNFRQFFYGYDYPDMQLDSDTNIKDDLGGAMSVKFKPGNSFNAFCSQHIENYNPDQYDILAIRVYYGKETLVTVYAVDRLRQENAQVVDKIPVKKFKINAAFLSDIVPFIEECNFTLTTGRYPLCDMEVINR
jgi:hypothetical protein